MKGLSIQAHLLIGALIVTLMPGGTAAEIEDGLTITHGNQSPASELELTARSKKAEYLVVSDDLVAQASEDIDVLLDYQGDEESSTPSPSSTEYWRDLHVAFESPTTVSDAMDQCRMLITPAPILIARQDDNGELAALSNSAAAADRSASAGIQNADVSASNAIASVSRTAAQSVSDALRSESSISSSAASALSSMSSLLSSVESSASSAVSAANSSASSAMMAASVLVDAASGKVNAAGSSFLAAAAKVTSEAQQSIVAIGAAATQLVSQSQAQAQASQALAVSSTNAAIAIVVSIIGSAIITFLIFFFVVRYRKKRFVARETAKYIDDHHSRGGRASNRDSRSSVGSFRSYYKDEKRPISVASRERSRSRSRHRRQRDRERERGGRRDRRGSDGESDRHSRHEKDSASSKTRVASTPRSPAKSFSVYSPRDEFSPKALTRNQTGLSESYPPPRTPKSPQRRLFNPDSVANLKEPEKVAKKPERVDTIKARKDLVSLAPTTGTTTNNLSSWLRDQTQRTSIYPSLAKPDLIEPLSRDGVERPKLQIPMSARGDIVEVNSRGSLNTVRTSDFPEGFIRRDQSELAEISNGKRDTKPPDPFRDSNFPFAKSEKPTIRAFSGLPSNPKGRVSGLPSNPKMKVRGSAATEASVEFETFEELSRKGSEVGTPRLGVIGSGLDADTRASQVGKAR